MAKNAEHIGTVDFGLDWVEVGVDGTRYRHRTVQRETGTKESWEKWEKDEEFSYYGRWVSTTKPDGLQ